MQQQGKECNRMQVQEEQLPKDYINRKISQLSELQLRYTYSNASSTSEFSMYQPTSEQFQAKFVKDEELYAEMLQKVAYVRSVVNVDSEDLCLYVLHTYQWNEEKLANFYFNEDWTSLAQAQQTYAHLQESQPQTIAECPVCLDHARLYSTGFCPHAYCARCWSAYLKQELQSGRIFPSCMEVPGCSRAPALRGFVEMVAPELAELNRKKTCVSYAMQNKDICYCPNERCPYFCIKPNMMEMSTVACPCGELYCYRCRKEPHYPVGCEHVKRWYTLLNSEQANNSWIRNNTRECPKCKQPIQKKVGCSHMKCLCQCQFCYECNRPWDQAHAAKKTECPNRASLPTRQQDHDRVVELDAVLTDMMREAEKNRALLTQCQELIQDQILQARVVQLKTEVVSAWMTFKWTKIVLCLQGRPDIDPQLQKECIESIHSVMEPVQIITRNAKCLASKELHNYGELVLQRNELLKKNIRTWLDAWELASSCY